MSCHITNSKEIQWKRLNQFIEINCIPTEINLFWFGLVKYFTLSVHNKCPIYSIKVKFIPVTGHIWLNSNTLKIISCHFNQIPPNSSHFSKNSTKFCFLRPLKFVLCFFNTTCRYVKAEVAASTIITTTLSTSSQRCLLTFCPLEP